MYRRLSSFESESQLVSSMKMGSTEELLYKADSITPQVRSRYWKPTRASDTGGCARKTGLRVWRSMFATAGGDQAANSSQS